MENSPYLFGDFDVAELSLIVFFGFFLGLVFYLRREDRREGYPLEDDVSGRLEPLGGLLFTAKPKTFLLPHGHGTRTLPNWERDRRELPARRSAVPEGSPIEPTGDPLTSGVGPSAWVERQDRPDLTLHGQPKIVPMRTDPTFSLAPEDPDPRGFPVVGLDKKTAGRVSDVWIDRAEYLIRYLEVELDPAVDASARRVLLPMTMAIVDKTKVRVAALRADQFARAPATRSPEQVTYLEEDKIVGFFGGGYLYATPERQEPLI